MFMVSMVVMTAICAIAYDGARNPAHQKFSNSLDRLHVHKEISSFFSDAQEFSLDYFEQENKLSLHATQNDHSPSFHTHTIQDKQLVVEVHSSLSDTMANSSSCLPTEAEHGQCNFRSAVSLCADHLTAEDRNCTIVMSPSDTVLLDAEYGQMPEVRSGLGSFSVVGKSSSFSLAAGSSSLQLLHISSDVIGDLRLTLSDMLVSEFGNHTGGGAIFCNGLIHSRIDNSVFFNNSGELGGALSFGVGNSYVDIVDCSFRENHAAYAG